MNALVYKNSVISQLDAEKGTGRQATVRPIPGIDGIVAEKAQTGLSDYSAPNWEQVMPQGRQWWFTAGLILAALVIFYILVKQKVIKL